MLERVRLDVPERPTGEEYVEQVEREKEAGTPFGLTSPIITGGLFGDAPDEAESQLRSWAFSKKDTFLSPFSYVSAAGVEKSAIQFACLSSMRGDEEAEEQWAEVAKWAKAKGAKVLESRRKRCENTLKRLKSKGIYRKTPRELWTFSIHSCQDSGEENYPKWAGVRDVLAGLFYDGSRFGGTDSEISDEVWMEAIELTIAMNYPDEIRSEDVANYAIHFPELAADLYVCVSLVFLAESIEMIREDAMTLASNFKALTSTLDVADSAIEELNQCQQELDELKGTSPNKKLVKENERLQEELARLERQMAATKAAADYRVEKAEKERDKLEKLYISEMDELASRIPEPPEEEEETDEEIEAQLNDIELYGDVELPKKGVLFMGGWPALCNSVRDRHPGWSFINSETHRASKASPHTKVMFLFYSNIGHKLVWQALRNMREDVLVVYVSQKNAEKMELEMKKGYALALKQREADAEAAEEG